MHYPRSDPGDKRGDSEAGRFQQSVTQLSTRLNSRLAVHDLGAFNSFGGIARVHHQL